MKQIINIRIEDNDIVLFKLNSGETITKADLRIDMLLNSVEYYIKTLNGNKKISFSNDGSKIIEPPLEEVYFINTL